MINLITLESAAGLLGIEIGEVLRWIEEDNVPYVSTPEGYLLPEEGFISSLSHLYDLAGAIREAEIRIAESGLTDKDLTDIASTAASAALPD